MEAHRESSFQRTKRIVCAYYNTPKGCAYGDRCRYLHPTTPALGQGEERTTAEFTSPSGRHFSDDSHWVPPRGRGRRAAKPSSAQQQDGDGRRRDQEAAARSNRGTKSDTRNRSGQHGSAESDGNQLHSLLDFPQLGSWHHHHAPVQTHANRPASSALTGPCATTTTTSVGRGRGRGQRNQPTNEFSLSALLEIAASKKSHTSIRRATEAPDSGSCDLLATELDQLHLRFSEDQLFLVEKSAAQQTYMLWYSPTSPNWPFSFNQVPLLITLPQRYPKELCAVTLEQGDILPDATTSQVNKALNDQLLTLRQSLGERALLLKPFLKWLDDNFDQLILQALDGVKDVEELHSLTQELVDEASEVSDSDSEDSGEHDDSDREDKDGLLLTAPHMVKHGTEVCMRGLQVSPEVGLIQCSLMKTTLVCQRCKEHMDMQLQPDKVLESSCPRCGVCYGVRYTPSTVHPDCLTLGFLDLKDCLVHDIILFGSELTIVCLSCKKLTHTKGVHYGHPHTLWCQHCHQKMTINVETCRLLEHESGPTLQLTVQERKRKEKHKKDFLIREGHPLPGRGTCDHYKKSCRWLRFPCCGKAYPCDVCHDSKEDHSYERASRMVCGFCAKEQTYTVDKPCVACKSALTGGSHTAYWEGGQGCRNKIKMSRNDPRKYTSVSKTGSKKMERVGYHGKMKVLGNK